MTPQQIADRVLSEAKDLFGIQLTLNQKEVLRHLIKKAVQETVASAAN